MLTGGFVLGEAFGMSGMAAVKWVAALGAAFFFTSLGSILLEKLCLEKKGIYYQLYQSVQDREMEETGL